MTRDWDLPASLVERMEHELGEIVDPCSTASVLSMSILEMGLIRNVTMDGGTLTVHLRLTSPSCMMVGYIAQEVTARLGGLPGVRAVAVAPDEGLDWDPELIDHRVAEERHRRLALLGIGRRPS